MPSDNAIMEVDQIGVDDSTLVKQTDLPSFDLHKVEEALRIGHRIFEGRPLTPQEIKRGIAEYRKFLADHKAAGMPEQFSSPGHLVDRVWHTHMCETDQYRCDCQQYFGRMFHHRSEICEGGVVD